MDPLSSSSAVPAGAKPAARWSPPPLILASLLFQALGVLALCVDPRHWGWYGAAMLANHVLLGIIGMFPRSRLIDRNLVRLPVAAARREEVCLTFDDGPDPAVTPQVLDLLDRAGAKASFFVTALGVQAHPELARETLRRGHSIENHSVRHSNAFAAYWFAGYRREIAVSQTMIAGITGRPPQFFRAPMGLRNLFLGPALALAGLRYVSWTRRGYDTRRGEPARVLARLTRNLAAGDILLLHDRLGGRTPEGKPLILDVLPALLERLAAQGLHSVSLPAGCRD